jgi:hypothetical protein
MSTQRDYARKMLADADAFGFDDVRAMAGMVGTLREGLRMVAPESRVLADADAFDFESAQAMAAMVGRLRESLRMALQRP